MGKLSNFLTRFTIDYESEGFKNRNLYIHVSAYWLLMVGLLNVVSLPLCVGFIIQNRNNNLDLRDKFILSYAVFHSVIINATLSSTVTFFVLKKCVKERQIGDLHTVDIAMISFITLPVAAIVFSAIVTVILCKARHSCTKENKYKFLVMDTCFTNPVTGLIVGTVALIGTLQDKLDGGIASPDTAVVNI